METIDTVIIGSVFLMFLSIGLAVYYLFFYAKEGEKCKPEKDADGFGIYQYDDNKECVLSNCMTGYKLTAGKCVKQDNNPPPPPPPPPPDGPSIAAKLRDPSPDVKMDDVSRPSYDKDTDCIIHVLGGDDLHYEDGLLKRIKFPTFTTDKNERCNKNTTKPFTKSDEIIPYYNSIGWKMDPGIVIEHFEYSKTPNIFFTELPNFYVRCGKFPGNSDNSCVRYGDEYMDYSVGEGKRYTNRSVSIDNIDTCESRCMAKKDCVAYSHNGSDCALAGVDYERSNFGAVNMLSKYPSSYPDSQWTTKIKTLDGIPLHPIF